jgi:hypothetical protein
VRRSSIECLKTYGRMSDNIESILNAIAKTGLESKEVRILPNN